MRIKVLIFAFILSAIFPAFSQEPDLAALKKQAQSGDVESELKLAQAYETGKGIRADKFEAADWYLRAAEAGNATAQNIVGVKYRIGEGLRKDPEQAIPWFEKSAKQGNADAMFNLGTCYYNGDGVAIDDSKSFAWFIVAKTFGSKAADDAVQRAFTDLTGHKLTDGLMAGASMLLTGDEIPARPEAASPWIEKAIDAGRQDATVLMAQLYLQGKGVPKDPQKAVDYCNEGAKKKYPSAYACIAFMYSTGQGEPLDLGRAAEWYTKAARCGEAKSIYLLSTLYGEGRGVQRDPVEQYALLLISEKAVPQARQDADRLKNELSQKDLKKAQKKAADFISKLDRSCLWHD